MFRRALLFLGRSHSQSTNISQFFTMFFSYFFPSHHHILHQSTRIHQNRNPSPSFNPYVHHVFTGWWFQPLWKILVNGTDYPIYYGKLNMFETTNQFISLSPIITIDLIMVHPTDTAKKTRRTWACSERHCSNDLDSNGNGPIYSFFVYYIYIYIFVYSVNIVISI